ncbi:hypothetical protein N601_22940 [Rhodococcus erythropolis DN1]|nr:hypothetical protein N601_22940 [Rhodococcus erythropolis DN1]
MRGIRIAGVRICGVRSYENYSHPETVAMRELGRPRDHVGAQRGSIDAHDDRSVCGPLRGEDVSRKLGGHSELLALCLSKVLLNANWLAGQCRTAILQPLSSKRQLSGATTRAS